MKQKYTKSQVIKLLWNWKEWSLDEHKLSLEHKEEGVSYAIGSWAIAMYDSKTIEFVYNPPTFFWLICMIPLCKRLERKVKNHNKVSV